MITAMCSAVNRYKTLWNSWDMQSTY